jgi:hypothetical protein
VITASILTTLLVLTAKTASADEISAASILAAKKAGATTEGIIAMVTDPANTVTVTADDLAKLRAAGVSDATIAAIRTRVPSLPESPEQVPPDDARLVDLVRLVHSGIAESIVVGQVKQSGVPFHLSINDLRYLKDNGIPESTITALMATGDTAAPVPGAEPTPAPAGSHAAPVVQAPETTAFDGLILKRGWMSKDRPGRLILEGASLAWIDGTDPKENFEFQIDGLEKVWFTCKAKAPENFCYQINFKIVKGAHYEFQDVNREAGGNAAVLAVMAALRTKFPEVSYGPPQD